MTFLSYIRGPLVDDWVKEQAQWLMDQVTGGVAHAEENLWATIEIRFHQAYTDTVEKQKAQHNIRDLKMKGDDRRGGATKFQWRNALNNQNPNAMDIGCTKAHTTFTDEEK